MGTLYLVATPLGNLEDLSPRAARILGEVDAVLAEDTRRTAVLLQHISVRAKSLLSLHEHNEKARLHSLLERLEEGASLALCSDAGMPLVSDPGQQLVEAAIEAGHTIVPLPGPNAAVLALVASGLPVEPFRFSGFLPRGASRKHFLESLGDETATHVFYESPKRLRETLEDIRSIWGERRICIGREMTKRFEEFLRGSVGEVLEALPEEILGEITLVVEGAPPRERNTAPEEDLLDLALRTALRAGASVKDAAQAAAEELGIARKVAYGRALELTQAKR